MKFEPPGQPYEVPAELKPMIEESVKRFEAKLGAMAIMARANGWIEDYRREVTQLAILAHAKGKLGK
jgi:hypothetical protein